MKSVKLIRYSRNAPKDYSVFLGNGAKHTFTNIKEVRKFLNETNGQLTEALHDLNSLYADVFNMFRRNWGCFDNKFNEERLIVASFNGIDKAMDLIVKRCHFTNGNYFVFSHFNYCFNGLTTILEILKEINTSRSNTPELYEIRSKQKVLNELANRVNDCSKIRSTSIYHSRVVTHPASLQTA